MIKIVTDSTCSPSEEYNLKNDIKVNPLKILFENQEFVEAENLYTTIYKKMADTKEIPKTSQPSLESYINIFNKIIKDGNEAIVYTISQTLSGTYNCACLARKSCDDPDKIHICDTQCIGQTAIGYIYETVEMIKQGKSIKQILSYIEKLQQNSAISFIPETLENLKKNGRIGGVKAIVASLLNIKPILIFKKGKLSGDKKTLGLNRAMNEIIKEVPEKTKRLFIIKAGLPDYFEKFKEKVISFFKNIPIELGIVSPVVGAHVGPCIGLAWIAE
ncbi:MAG: DegV family protein [Clostridia bacterium]|nr:DegV family protein [Clostridia bacterium]